MFPCCGTLLAFLGVFHLQPVQPAEQPAQHCLPELSKDEFKFSGDGYLQLPNKKAGQRNFTDLRFTFRTLTDEGLLLLTINPQLTAYKSLKLVHGKLVYQYDLGSGHSSMVVLSDIRFDDGKWHVMEARQFNDKDIVLIDGKLVSSVEIPESVRDSFTESLVYVGGVEAVNVIKDAVEKNFTGSVKDIRRGNTKIDRHLAFKRQNVLSGCNKRLRREAGNDFHLSATYVGATNLELSWNPNHCYSNFKIQWEEKDGNKTQSVNTTGLRVEVTGLKSNTMYIFTIFGYTNDTLKEIKEIDFTTASSNLSLILDDVTENTASFDWSSAVELSFEPPYRLAVFIENNTRHSQPNLGNETILNETRHTLLGLMPGETYRVVLTDSNSVFKADRIIKTKASAVKDFNCKTGDKEGEINCSWARHFDKNCFYIVSTTDDHESSWKLHELNWWNNVIKNLRPGERYSLSVYDYPHNKSINIMIKNVTAKPGISKDLFRNINESSDNFIVSFYDDTDRSVDYYNVTLKNATQAGSELEPSPKKLSREDKQIEFTNLEAGYFYMLQAYAVSHGAVSETIGHNICRVPNDPSSINCTTVTEDSFIILINPPSVGHANEYSATLRDDPWRELPKADDSKMEISVSNLKPFRNYTVTVKSHMNQMSLCNQKSYGIPIVCETKEGVPEQIRNLDNVSDHSGAPALRLRWNKPLEINGNLQGYVIKIEGMVINNTCEARRHHSPVCESYNYRDAESGTCYDVEVAAWTRAGTGKSVLKRFCTKESKTEPLVIVAGILLPVLIIVLIVLLVLYFLQRNPRQAQSVRHLSHRLRERASEMLMFKQPTVFSKPVKISDFVEYVTGLEKDSGLKFTEEYEELKFVGRNQSKDEAELQCNRVKNRFTNILPYDISRVKLLAMEDVEGSDYINASWIPGFHSKREFIASQGPLPSTIDDFWRMVWENNCPAIVMLTQCIEKGHIKCEQYWPLDTDPVFYGDVKVELQNADKNEDRHIRYFKISLGAQTRDLVHFHYIGWPDMYVPDRGSLIMFVREVRKLISGHGGKGPVVVHCSAGVGRTGTFIALDTHMHQIEADHDLDVYGVVLQMRMSRVLMVQTEAQYVFIYECLRHILEEKMGKVPEIKTASEGDGKDNESKDKTSQPETEVKSGSLAEEKTSIEEPKVEAAIVETSFSSPAETKTSGSENNSANNEEQNQKSNSVGDSAKVESEPKS